MAEVKIDAVEEGVDPGAIWTRYFYDTYPDQFGVAHYDPDAFEYSPDTAYDDQGQAQMDPRISSGLWETHRTPFRSLFKGLVKGVFDRYRLPRTGGVDIGSGVTGELVNEWLPLSPQERATWTESDINPASVAGNRARHPQSRVEVASMHHLRRDLKLEGATRPRLITGLSSLDAPIFLEKAVEEVRETLKPDGFLLHIQDVRPGSHMGLKQLEKEGRKGVHPILYAPPSAPVEHINPLVYVVDGKIVSSVELFRRYLGGILVNSGWKILQNNWMAATQAVEPNDPTGLGHSWIYLMNMRAPTHPSVTGNKQVRHAFAVVTVAQKI